MFKVLVADDHAILRRGLKDVLAVIPEAKLIGEATNGAEVLEALRQEKPDLLIMDLSMPQTNGVELVHRVLSHYPALPILVFSMINDIKMVQSTLKAGVRGYVTKDSLPDELISAIRKVANGGKYIEHELAERMLFSHDQSSKPHHILTSRELEVFELLVQGRSVSEIAEQLKISNKTISTHKVHLLEKMNLKNIPELVRYAVEHGLFGWMQHGASGVEPPETARES
jgi:two-component system, NarL family, invasion response regulator UvrY